MSDSKRIVKRIRNSAVIKSPLLFEAVGLCPVVAIALSLKQAAFLALVTAIEMIVCEVLASLLLKNVRRYWRVALYVVFGVAVIFSIMLFVQRFFPQMAINFGIYLPLMAVNSLVALHCERVAVKNNVTESVVDAVSASVSYGVVAIIVGVVREFLAYGTIGGLNLNTPVKVPAILMPFGALLIMGFLGAMLKAFIAWRYPNASPDRAFNTNEIRRSLRGPLKELMKDDYNPYDENGDGDADTLARKPRKEKAIKERWAKLKKEKAKKAVAEEQEQTQKIVLTEKEKFASVIKKKPEKKKKVKNTKKTKATLSAESRTGKEISGDRTYLDDFSDMLSELEEYKTRESENKDENGKENNGGDRE